VLRLKLYYHYKKTNDRKKLSFAGRYSFEFVSKKILLLTPVTLLAGGSGVIRAGDQIQETRVGSIDSYFTEIRMREGGGGGGSGRGGSATIIVAIIKVSLNLRGQAQLKSSHSLFQQVSLV